MTNKLFAEFFGTFWLVLGGCGSAVLAATFPLGAVAYRLIGGRSEITARERPSLPHRAASLRS